MKKLVSIAFISIMMVSCVQSPKENTTLKSGNLLSGVFTSRDRKAEILFKNMTLFTKADFSYVDTLFSKRFYIKNFWRYIS
jgi:hypothetical protein|tara:strand:+ start:87 stop:329 length:243 start_codon:yes stop_codon:yes gene_type:complete